MKLLRHKLSLFFLWLAYKVEPRFINNLTNTTMSATASTASKSTDEFYNLYEKAKTVSDEPSGIVYRPTVAELNKMHEDKQVREAKEAMAETLGSVEEPEL